MFHKKGPLSVFLIIHSNDDQFTQNFYQLQLTFHLIVLF